MASFSGYIIANEGHLDVKARSLELNAEAKSGVVSFNQRGTMFSLKQWHHFELRSLLPLADEEDQNRANFVYPVIVIKGYGKFVVLAHRRKIVDYVLANVFDELFFPNYRKINIYVDRLIEACADAEHEFLVTSLHGRFSGANRDLKTMSLYGDNVTRSSLYSEFHHLFNFYSCGVGRRLFGGLPRLRPNEEGEIVRVSNDGFISLNVAAKARAQELMHVVNHIVRNRWVDEWVPGLNEDAS